MWDTAIDTGLDTGASTGTGFRGHVVHLTHDLPCPRCGHAAHRYLSCSETCDCVPPPVPGSVALAA